VKVIDIVGQRFGRLVVIGRARRPDRRMPDQMRSAAFWECRCDCGGRKVVAGLRLRNGNNRSCGCLAAEHSRAAVLMHGQRRRDAVGSMTAGLTT